MICIAAPIFETRTDQKKLVRVMTFAPFDTHAQPIFSKYGILNIFDLYKMQVAILAHYYLKGESKLKLKNVLLVMDSHKFFTDRQQIKS